ncbi:hypothetical protein THRCLA_11421 [Thraustotheca clavata]|uniref:Apple domain-containing protein n=1 Tax=Thraustotheca clavata TaxID=74557 RepID=A0A1V9Y7R8_9STRA|nr:hypothetical protein THRCLA_11421 [Thraustotheca clavata]
MKLYFVAIPCVLAAPSIQQQQFKPCSIDADCNADFFCKPTNDGTFSMCQRGIRPRERKFTCAENSDLWGDDYSNLHTGFDGCLYRCKLNAYCTAISWVKDIGSEQGQCYFKHLADGTRSFTLSPKATRACKETTIPATQWVVDKTYQLHGSTLATGSNIPSLTSCQRLCERTEGCVAISYQQYSQRCVLQTSADNYFPIWSKAVDLGAVAAIKHNYKACYGDSDLQNQGDVFNFQGSFQNCANCFVGGQANAFAWYLGPTTDFAQPINSKGTCYCKKVAEDVSPPISTYPGTYGGTILCIA